MCCKCCSETQRKVWVFGSGVFIGVIALILVLGWPQWGEDILESQLTLKEGSLMYDTWKETPIPIYLKFHLFNWTNSDQISNPDVKPHFKECGPYVFKEKHKRVKIQWNKNGTVSFNQIRTWQFDESQSGGSLDDVITSLNPITATVANMMRKEMDIFKEVINMLLNKKGGSLTITKTARELLFDGYDDALLTFIKKFNSTAIDIPYDRFGWFVDRNNSDSFDGRFTIYNGQKDIKTMGLVDRWNGQNETEFFDGECGRIYGTTGELWPVKMDPVAPISVFVSDLCRSITLNYHDKYEAHGIEGSQWMGGDKVFDNGHLYEENRCFCLEEDFADCPPTGNLDISKCQLGAPATMSYPHFYMADPSYLNAVDGLSPNSTLHKFTIALHPETGIPLDLAARIQLNMYSRQDSKIDIFKNVQNVLLPVFWFAQMVHLDSDLASQVKLAILVPDLGLYISYGLFGVAAIIIIIGIILTLTKSWVRTPKDQFEK